jgi:hypothetical protein
VSEPATRRLKVIVETKPPQKPGVLRTIVRGVLSFFTEGAVAPGPRSRVFVVDRTTGQVVLEHDWGRSPDAAERDREALEATLATHSVEEFCSEHGVTPPSPE